MSHLHQLLLILTLITFSHIHALPWTSIGPTTIDSRTTTGTITHITSDGVTGATIITPGSGLWNTLNIGVNDPTWTHVDVMNMCQSITAFHVYTSSPKWQIAACGTTQRTFTSRVTAPAIWLSVNGIWKLLPININITSSITDVHITTITPPTLFIATRQGMWRVMTDSVGNVMTSQQVLMDGVLKVTVEDVTSTTSTIMYASTPRAQLYLSSDLGLTWNMTSPITSLYTSSCPYTELEHAIIASTSNMTYIAMASHQCIVILSTTTQGSSWTRELSINISTSTDVTSLAMVMINSNITYICGTGTYFGRLTRGSGFTTVTTTKQASYNCKQMMYDTTSIYVASDAGLSRFTLSSQTFTDTTLTVTMPSVTEILSSAYVAQSGIYITAAQSFPILRGSSAGTFISHPTNTLQPTSVSYDSVRGIVYTTTTSLRTIERTLPPTVAIEIPFRDIARHNKSNDCWIMINHYVLDVTSIINIHPGGVTNLVTQCGKDATQIWNAVHMSSTISRLPRYIIGTLSYTSIDVATHSSPSDCYIIHMDRVLNVTMYITMYPNLINLCGTDATDSLTQTPSLTPSQIKSSFIGRLTIVADNTIRTYSYAHVARHHVIHDCWVVFNQKVVDVTSLIQSGLYPQFTVDKCGSDFGTTNSTLISDMSSLVLGTITTPIPFATLNVANNVPTYVAPNTQVPDQGMICSTFHNNGLTSSACYILDFATNTTTSLPTDLTAPYEQYLLGGTRAGVADTTAIIAVSSTGAVYVRANGVSATRPIAPWSGMIPVGIAQNPSNYWDVIVTLSSGLIYRTIDFGLTWNNVTGNLPSTSISSVVILDMDTYIATLVATHMGVYVTTDDIKIKGQWARIGESFPTVTTSSLQYVNDYDMLMVGTVGRGLYTLSQVTNTIDNARTILLTVPITTVTPTTMAPTITTTPPTTPGGGNNIPTDPITPTSPPTTRPDVTSPPTTGVGAASGSTGAATSSSTTILGFDLKIAIPIMAGAVVIVVVAILLLWKWCSSRDAPLRTMRKGSMDFSDAVISGAPSAPTYAMSIKFSHDVDVAKLPTQRQNAPSIYDEPAITDSPLHSASIPVKNSVDHVDWNTRQQRMTVASGGWYEGSSQPSGYGQDPNYVDPQQQQQEYRWSQDDGQQTQQQQQQEYQWSQDTSQQQQTWDNPSQQQQEYQWTQPESPSTQQWTQTRTWRNPSAALGWNT